MKRGALSVLLLVTGCTVGPNYSRSATAAPMPLPPPVTMTTDLFRASNSSPTDTRTSC